MLPLVDRDGLTKPVLQIIAEEAIASGIEEICVVCARAMRRSTATISGTIPPPCNRPRGSSGPRNRPAPPRPGAATPFRRPAGAGRLRSRSLVCRSFVGSEPFLLLLGDHLYISSESSRCARQLIDLATAENCAVSAVQATREHLIHQYGTFTGRRMPEHPEIYVIEEIIEKPNPTQAELRLHVPGIPRGITCASSACTS